MSETEVPDVWWSPTHGPIMQDTREGSAFYGEHRPANTVRWMEQLPDDAVLLVAAPAHTEPTVEEWAEVRLTGQPAHPSDPPYDFTFRSNRDAWAQMATLLRRAHASWTDVTVQRRTVRRMTWETEWADVPADTEPTGEAP